MDSLELDAEWLIPERDLELRFSRSGGPGGQNVNKVSSKVELRLNLAETAALTGAQKSRLRAAFPSHVTLSGDFVVVGDRHRSQLLNQADVRERLVQMILSIRRPPPRRVATKPSRAAKKRRLNDKRHRSDIKRGRQTQGD
ncbi:MAG: hypothetical protein RJA70_7 [Pseudomonadota bacterium]|jgi:ribosome-associated protein